METKAYLVEFQFYKEDRMNMWNKSTHFSLVKYINKSSSIVKYGNTGNTFSLVSS